MAAAAAAAAAAAVLTPPEDPEPDSSVARIMEPRTAASAPQSPLMLQVVEPPRQVCSKVFAKVQGSTTVIFRVTEIVWLSVSWAEYTTRMGETEVCEVQLTEALGRPDTLTCV